MKKAIYFLFLSIGLISCEREFIPDDIQQTPDIVVEGYIEASDRALPPYVILTKSSSFFKEIDPTQLEKLIVRNALVTISDGNITDTLPQFCLNSLTAQQKELVIKLLGLNVDSLGGADICIYINPFGKIKPKEGGSYTLSVQAEGKRVAAVTTIPTATPLDSIVCLPPADKSIDTLMQMRGYISDPGAVRNFYRVLISSEGGPFFSNINAVINDDLFNGKPSFQFPLSKPRLPNQKDFDFITAGLYHKGENVTVKYTSIDEAQFNFWNTASQSAQNQGPFSTYTRIRGNIKGGLGIWGGVAAKYYDVKVPQ